MHEELAKVFEEASARIDGKGAVRHGTSDTPLTEQPIFAIPRELYADEATLLFQAVKKIFESRRLAYAPAKDELLDALVYLAAAIMYKDELAGK